MKVQLFIPCFVDQLYPDTAFNMIRVLEKAGCTVAYNTAQTCCGQPMANAGFDADEIKATEESYKLLPPNCKRAADGGGPKKGKPCHIEPQ